MFLEPCSGARLGHGFRPPPPVAWLHMHDGTWTLAACPASAQSALVEALGISEITAAVLVRRGYTDPDQARVFLAGENPPHDPFLLGDMAAACERIRAAVARGMRICV